MLIFIQARTALILRRWSRNKGETMTAMILVAVISLVLSFALVTVDYGLVNPLPFDHAQDYVVYRLSDPERGTERPYFSAAEVRAISSLPQLAGRVVASNTPRTTVEINGYSERLLTGYLNDEGPGAIGLPLLTGAVRASGTPAAYVASTPLRRTGLTPTNAIGTPLKTVLGTFPIAGIFDDRFGWAGADVLIARGEGLRSEDFYMLAIRYGADAPVGLTPQHRQDLLAAISTAGTTLSGHATLKTQSLEDRFASGARQGFSQIAMFSVATIAACLFGLAGLIVSKESRLLASAALETGLGREPRFAAIDRVLDYGLLCGLGGCAGIILSYGLGPTLQSLLPRGFLPRGALLRLDGKHILFALSCLCLIALITAACGVAVSSSRRVSRRVVRLSLDRQSLAPRFLTAAAVLQIAVATSSVIVGGQYLSALAAANARSPSEQYRHVFVVDHEVSPGPALLTRVDVSRSALLAQGIRADVAFTAGGMHPTGGAMTGAKVGPQLSTTITTALIQMTPDYLSAMDIRLLAGTPMSSSDHAGRRKVAIVNAAFASQMGPGRAEDVVGSVIALPELGGLSPTLKDARFEIIAVAQDRDFLSCADGVCATVYIPASVLEFARTMIVATRGPVPTLRSLQAALSSSLQGPTLVENVATQIDTRTTQQLMARTRLSVVLAALLLTLSALNVRAAADSVAQRSLLEYSLRSALGASPFALVRQFLGRNLFFVVTGIGLGLYATSRWADYFLPALEGHAAPQLIYAMAASLIIAFSVVALLGPTARLIRSPPYTLVIDRT